MCFCMDCEFGVVIALFIGCYYSNHCIFIGFGMGLSVVGLGGESPVKHGEISCVWGLLWRLGSNY